MSANTGTSSNGGSGTTGTLGTATIKSAVDGTAQSLILVQNYAKTITTQPIITGLDEIPNLGTHQQNAIDHANYWLNTCQPSVIQVESDLLSFANGFNAYYQPLLTLATQIQNGDNSKVNEFIEGLNELNAQVTSKRGEVQTVIQQLDTFRTELASDVSNFNSDASTAQTKIVGDNGEIATLNDHLNALNSAMAKDNAMIAGGAVADVVGGLMICVGVLAEIETAGVSTALILGGVAVIAGGSTMLGIAAKNLSDAQSDYGSTTAHIAQLKNDVSVLTTIQGQLNNFSTEANNAYAAVVQVDQAWQTVGTNFNTLINDLTNNISTTSPFIVAEVTQAGSDWSDLKTHIEGLQAFNDIPTTNQTVTQYVQAAAA